MGDGSWVGVDLHARSAVAGVVDAASGELWTERVPAASEPLVVWLSGLPQPVRVAYEAGPTGFALARACARAGIECLVAAPGRIPRAPAERVKTDRRDAERLARLLRLGELTAVRVPSELEEQARDLVRAREDVRGDLMRARHRLSKLLLRHELLWQRSAWTREHDRWLRGLRFAGPFAICFDVVPEQTRPWNPLHAPHAIVTKRAGKIPAVPRSGASVVIGCRISWSPKKIPITPSAREM